MSNARIVHIGVRSKPTKTMADTEKFERERKAEARKNETEQQVRRRNGLAEPEETVIELTDDDLERIRESNPALYRALTERGDPDLRVPRPVRPQRWDISGKRVAPDSQMWFTTATKVPDMRTVRNCWTPIVALLIAGCSGPSTDGPGQGGEVPTVLITTTSRTVAPPTAKPHGPRVKTPVGTLAVYRYRANVKLDSAPDEPDTHWAAIDAELCYKIHDEDENGDPTEALPVGWDYWSVQTKDNSRYQAFTSGSTPAFLTPGYPQDGEVVAFGECVRGWIMVPVANGAKIVKIRYKNTVDPLITWPLAD